MKDFPEPQRYLFSQSDVTTKIGKMCFTISGYRFNNEDYCIAVDSSFDGKSIRLERLTPIDESYDEFILKTIDEAVETIINQNTRARLRSEGILDWDIIDSLVDGL